MARRPGDINPGPRVVVVIVDGLPVELADEVVPDLPFLGPRLPHGASAVSCFPSTTGPAYFPFLAGCTPGRANVPGIRWFDRTRPTRSAFPHRGLRSYVGPDARRLATDTQATTLFARHAWPVSSPIPKDLPKRGELSRDLVWATAHLTHRWDQADRRTSWKLGRALRKDREIVFAVFPSIDELGHTFGLASDRPRAALEEIDRQLAEKLAAFDGEILLSADHGLTDTHAHLDSARHRRGLRGNDDRVSAHREAVSERRRVRVRERHGQRLSPGGEGVDGTAGGRALP